MRVRPCQLLLTCVALMGAALPQARGQQARTFWIKLHQNTWAVAVDLPGFVVETNGAKPDGRRYLLLTNSQTGLVASVTLERSPRPADLSGCESFHQGLAKQANVRNARLWENNKMRFLEYSFVLEEGKVEQRNLFVCLAREHVFVGVHLSTMSPTLERAVMDVIISTVRIDESPPKTSFDYWLEGSWEYRAGRLKKSIAPYKKALDLERQDRQLDSTFWRVLIDNLGMAFGITGDLQQSRQVFEYGISQDPDYPLFYYNLACAYAEMKNRDAALANLRLAFARKQNVIPSERMPDPRLDDSFKRFMGQREFRNEVEEMARYLDDVTASLPGKPWFFAVHLPGYKLTGESVRTDEQTFMRAWHEGLGIHVDISVKPLKPGDDRNKCKEYGEGSLGLRKGESVYASSAIDVRRFETPNSWRLDYVTLSPTPRGLPGRSRTMHACFFRDDAYASIGLFKIRGDKKDELRFDQIFSSARFVELPAAPKSSNEIFGIF